MMLTCAVLCRRPDIVEDNCFLRYFISFSAYSPSFFAMLRYVRLRHMFNLNYSFP